MNYFYMNHCKQLIVIKLFISSGLDTPLQILDARTLMKQQACVSSTPGSSLDLEWEHEGEKIF